MVLIEVQEHGGHVLFINPDQIVQVTSIQAGIFVRMAEGGSFYSDFKEVGQFLDYLQHAKPAFWREP
jgi:hypothetical protein